MAKKPGKNYVHETHNEVKTLQLRNNRLRQDPAKFEPITDIENKPVPATSIKRSNEMTGAGIEYLTAFIDFICTHFPNSIDTGNENYYQAPLFEWATFLDVVTGGIKGQRQRAEEAIMKYIERPGMKLCLCADGDYRAAPPFVVVFNWGTRAELEAAGKAIFEGLNSSKRGKKKDGSEHLPIKTVSIMFFKPLFDGFMRKNFSNYTLPAGMYAKIYQSLDALRLSEDDRGTRATVYARFARYITQHNNLTGRERKDAYGQIGKTTIDVIDMLQDVNPSLYRDNGHGSLAVNWLNFTAFITMAQSIYWSIDHFICYPVFHFGAKRQDTIAVDLYKTGEAARKAAELDRLLAGAGDQQARLSTPKVSNRLGQGEQ